MHIDPKGLLDYAEGIGIQLENIAALVELINDLPKTVESERLIHSLLTDAQDLLLTTNTTIKVAIQDYFNVDVVNVPEDEVITHTLNLEELDAAYDEDEENEDN